MTFPKIVVCGAIFLFGVIGFFGIIKKAFRVHSLPKQQLEFETYSKQIHSPLKEKALYPLITVKGGFPKVDRIGRLFTLNNDSLPIVRKITYSSSVPWLKGRPAWISDYAKHFATSRHFIARSLSGNPVYETKLVHEGSLFNVYDDSKGIQFFLVIDLKQTQMGLYYLDEGNNERVFLKSYPVGLGRAENNLISLTPVGGYALGENVGIYNKGEMGYHLDRKVEMLQVFGTRWMPLVGAKGIGIQGAPWIEGRISGQLIENQEVIGKYESDGCIRMLQKDVEELFAIVLTKPTYVQIVQDLKEAGLPGAEVAMPK